MKSANILMVESLLESIPWTQSVITVITIYSRKVFTGIYSVICRLCLFVFENMQNINSQSFISFAHACV